MRRSIPCAVKRCTIAYMSTRSALMRSTRTHAATLVPLALSCSRFRVYPSPITLHPTESAMLDGGGG